MRHRIYTVKDFFHNAFPDFMMEQTRNIDIVLGGHSHSYFEQLEYKTNLDGKAVPNDQNGKHGIYVGKITIDVTRK